MEPNAKNVPNNMLLWDASGHFGNGNCPALTAAVGTALLTTSTTMAKDL